MLSTEERPTPRTSPRISRSPPSRSIRRSRCSRWLWTSGYPASSTNIRPTLNRFTIFNRLRYPCGPCFFIGVSACIITQSGFLSTTLQVPCGSCVPWTDLIQLVTLLIVARRYPLPRLFVALIHSPKMPARCFLVSHLLSRLDSG